jgi:hypothetical protein
MVHRCELALSADFVAEVADDAGASRRDGFSNVVLAEPCAHPERTPSCVTQRLSPLFRGLLRLRQCPNWMVSILLARESARVIRDNARLVRATHDR